MCRIMQLKRLRDLQNLSFIQSTVKSPCATTSHKQPPPTSRLLSEKTNFSRSRPFLVSDRNHFLTRGDASVPRVIAGTEICK